MPKHHKIKAIRNSKDGYDLQTNGMVLHTGNEEQSREFWTRLQGLCGDVIWDLYHAIPADQKKELNA